MTRFAQFVLAVSFGGANFAGLKAWLMSTTRTMGYLGLLLSAGVLIGFVRNYHRVPQQFTELFVTSDYRWLLALYRMHAGVDFTVHWHP